MKLLRFIPQEINMAVQEFHRFRMQIDLSDVAIADPMLPAGYRWQAWGPAQLERHAITKWHSFRSELDALVFPCLGELPGCRRLMAEIARQRTFLPGVTWLIVYQPESEWPPEDCGTIQGVRRNRKLGAVQNVGITPAHRGLGLGRMLVLKSLSGFQEAGVRNVYLEVTAENKAAVGLYRSIGFSIIKTMLKTVEVPDLVSQ